MSRYIYSIVRCLPDPRTGEFMNVGAIAGDPATGDWAIRQLSNTERVRKFAGDKALKHALNFVYVLGSEIDQNLQALDEGGEPLGEAWLTKLHRDQRNVVQLSPPAPMVAETAEEALEVIFNHLIIEKPSGSSKPPLAGLKEDRVAVRE